jgi:hypothetical protein
MPHSLASCTEFCPIVSAEVRRAARVLLSNERVEHTLQPTALAHEALLRLGGGKSVPTGDPKSFISLVVREMRQALTDHARKAKAHKRSWHLRGEAPDEAGVPTIDPAKVVLVDAGRESGVAPTLRRRDAIAGRVLRRTPIAGLHLRRLPATLSPTGTPAHRDRCSQRPEPASAEQRRGRCTRQGTSHRVRLAPTLERRHKRKS